MKELDRLVHQRIRISPALRSFGVSIERAGRPFVQVRPSSDYETLPTSPGRGWSHHDRPATKNIPAFENVLTRGFGVADGNKRDRRLVVSQL